jgi:hypothetical protein
MPYSAPEIDPESGDVLTRGGYSRTSRLLANKKALLIGALAIIAAIAIGVGVPLSKKKQQQQQTASRDSSASSANQGGGTASEQEDPDKRSSNGNLVNDATAMPSFSPSSYISFCQTSQVQAHLGLLMNLLNRHQALL